MGKIKYASVWCNGYVMWTFWKGKDMYGYISLSYNKKRRPARIFKAYAKLGKSILKNYTGSTKVIEI